jgi:lipopolysaccharide/colanic/teichoic acid biosynthesis glycosyltransferase
VGRWIERLWIVELPQLWNVLRGDMSLVGNRPIPDYVIAALGATPEVLERFASPQGLTGFVQVIGRDRVSDAERLALEFKYSRIFEEGDVFLTDLRIILMTLLVYVGVLGERAAADFLQPGDATPVMPDPLNPDAPAAGNDPAPAATVGA